MNASRDVHTTSVLQQNSHVELQLTSKRIRTAEFLATESFPHIACRIMKMTTWESDEFDRIAKSLSKKLRIGAIRGHENLVEVQDAKEPADVSEATAATQATARLAPAVDLTPRLSHQVHLQLHVASDTNQIDQKNVSQRENQLELRAEVHPSKNAILQ